MAVKVKNTTISGGLSGRDKGINKVFSHKSGKNHSIAKQFVQPRNPNSLAQSQVRGVFAVTSQRWSTLTDVQRAGWNADAPNWVNTGIFGDRNQSGKNLFTGVNVALASAGFPTTDDVLTRDIITDLDDTYQIASPGELKVQLECVTVGTGEILQIRCGKQENQGTANGTGLVVIRNVPATQSTLEDITQEYTARFGGLVVGKKVFYEVRVIGVGGNKITARSGYFIVA